MTLSIRSSFATHTVSPSADSSRPARLLVGCARAPRRKEAGDAMADGAGRIGHGADDARFPAPGAGTAGWYGCPPQSKSSARRIGRCRPAATPRLSGSAASAPPRRRRNFAPAPATSSATRVMAFFRASPRNPADGLGSTTTIGPSLCAIQPLSKAPPMRPAPTRRRAFRPLFGAPVALTRAPRTPAPPRPRHPRRSCRPTARTGRPGSNARRLPAPD